MTTAFGIGIRLGDIQGDIGSPTPALTPHQESAPFTVCLLRGGNIHRIDKDIRHGPCPVDGVAMVHTGSQIREMLHHRSRHPGEQFAAGAGICLRLSVTSVIQARVEGVHRAVVGPCEHHRPALSVLGQEPSIILIIRKVTRETRRGGHSLRHRVEDVTQLLNACNFQPFRTAVVDIATVDIPGRTAPAV